MDTEFLIVVESIAACARAVVEDARNEHDRWRVYLAAMDSDECGEMLLQAVGLEPDVSVALGIVLMRIERVPDSDRQAWVDRLPTEPQREYAARRSTDLKLLETRPLAPLLQEQSADSWSDWLQLRLAECSPEHEVLSWLSQHGRTRRIRRIALERSRKL